MTTTYQIVADSYRTFALRNKETGQFEHEGFPTIKMVLSFFQMHFAWRTEDNNPYGAYRLEGR